MPPFAAIDTLDAARPLAERALKLVDEIYPLCRSITGEGVRQTLRHVAQRIPLEISEVPTGTAVFDWEVPREWTIREAYIADASGRRLVDFGQHALHVVGYSAPVRARMPLQQLRAHLHSLPEQPEVIPYRTSYYRETWGFCLPHRQLLSWPEGEYEVVIDSELAPGSLTYAECLVPGRSNREFIVYTHTCHPAMANDNASGIAVATVLAEEALARQSNLSLRFIFGPGTIGSICWLARNQQRLDRVRGGLVVGLLGDPGPLTYKRSRQARAEVDLIAERVVRELDPHARIVEFAPYGYDERQFCSPGINLPVGRVTRSPDGGYPQYHTSADKPSMLDLDALAQSIRAVAGIIDRVDENRLFRSLSAKGEPRLGKRGLFRSMGGASPGDSERAMLWLLNMADGAHGLQDAHAASSLPLATLEAAAGALVAAGLLEEVAA